MGKREILLLLLTFIIWIITLRKPFIGLLYLFLFSTLELQLIYTNLEPFHLIKLTSIVIFISFLLNIKNTGYKITSHFYLMGLLFLIMCLSRLNAGIEVFGHYYMEFYKIIFLFLVMTNLINNEERLKIFSWILVISYTALCFVARYHWTETPYYWWDRNYFALELVSIIPLAFFLTFSEKRAIIKLEGICYLLVLILICLRTHSRGGLVGLSAVFFLFLIHKPSLKKYLILIPIILIALNRVSEKEIQRYETLKSYMTERSAQQRLGAWRVGLKMFKAHPIIGIGTGEFSNKFMQYADEKDWEMVGGTSNAHSIYVQIAAETGLLGLFTFLLLIIVTLKDIWKLWLVYKKKSGGISGQIGMSVAIGLIGYLISGMFLSAAYSQHLYVLMALMVAAKMIAEKNKETESEISISVEFPQFGVVTRTLVLGTCVYLALY